MSFATSIASLFVLLPPASDFFTGLWETALAPDETVFRVTFWSADWTPWRALTQLAAQWPTLRFAVRPSYDAA